MNDRALDLVHQLMEELQDSMHPSEDEMGSRLGRPKIEVMKMQAGEPDGDEGMGMPDKMGSMDGDMGDDSPMGPDDDDMDSPDEMLKQRLMKMRG